MLPPPTDIRAPVIVHYVWRADTHASQIVSGSSADQPLYFIDASGITISLADALRDGELRDAMFGFRSANPPVA